VRANPERAPEAIALEASRRFADDAAQWAARERREGHSPHQLAKRVRRRHVNLARLGGAALGIGGMITLVPNLIALGWIQGRMVFFIAAAYGFDPHHPMRPAELLTLQGFYDTPMAAKAALDHEGQLLGMAMAGKAMSGEGAAATRLVKLVGSRIATRAGGRVIPFLGAPLSAIQNSRGTSRLANRAIAYYGGRSQP
jgi:hypothetical protein